MTWYGDLAAQGDLFVDLATKKNLIDMSGFDQKFVNDWCLMNGKQVGLPTGINAFTTFANKTLMQKMGVALRSEWTWEQILEEGAKLHANNKDFYLLNQPPAQIRVFLWTPYLLHLTSGQLVNDNYTVGFDRASTVKSFQYLKGCFDSGVLQPVSESAAYSSAGATNPRWVNQQIPMALDFTSGYAGWKNSIPNVEWVTLGFPISPDSKQTGIIVRPAQTITIARTSRNIDEAAKFINWFLNSRDAAMLPGLERSVPASAPARQALLDAGMVDKNIAGAVDYALKHAGLAANTLSSNQEIFMIIEDVIQKVGFARLTPEQAADELIKRGSDRLAELKAARK